MTGSSMCFGCLKYGKRHVALHRCKECYQAYCERQEAVADKKAIVQACRSVTTALASAKRDKDPAALPEIINAFLKGVGGVENVGQILMEDFNRLRGVGLTEEELMKHQFKEGTIQRYWQMLLRGINSRDQQVATVDLQGFTDAELKAVLLPLAAELLLEDPQFRVSVIVEAVSRDPSILDELLRERGKVVDSTVASPVVTPPRIASVEPPPLEDTDPAELSND